MSIIHGFETRYATPPAPIQKRMEDQSTRRFAPRIPIYPARASPHVRLIVSADLERTLKGFDSVSSRARMEMANTEATLHANPMRPAKNLPTSSNLSSMARMMRPTTPARRLHKRTDFHLLQATPIPRLMET